MSKKAIENIKSVILVVLFLTTILLLYLIWGDPSSGKLAISDLIPSSRTETERLSAKEVIYPSEVFYSSGDGAFVKAASRKEIFEHYNKILKSCSSQGTVMVTEITKEQYTEALTNYQSVEMKFIFQIPFTEYCNLFEINRSSSFANIETISTLAVSAAAPDSFLIADESNWKYYRLVCETNEKIEIEKIENPSDITLYSARTILGAGTDSLFPLEANSKLREVSYVKTPQSTEESRQEISQKIFGDNFNFVRRIVDSSENYTYMYGYGQKSLTIYASGGITYKETVKNGDSADVVGDLETAINFVQNLIGFSDSHSRVKYVLQEVYTNGSGKAANHIYRFKQETTDGFEILYPEDALVISVEKGQVAEFRGVGISSNYAQWASVYKPAYNPANTIARAAQNNENLEVFVENMRSMEPALFPKDGKLIPVWALHIHDLGAIHFDLYTGDFLE